MKKIFLDELPRLMKDSRSKGKYIDWNKSVGEIVSFIYDDIEGKIKILEYNTGILKVEYDENIYYINYEEFRKCCLGNIVEKNTFNEEKYNNYIQEYKRLHKDDIFKKIFLENLPKKRSGQYKGKIDWEVCKNHKIYFIYNNIEGYITILNVNLSKRIINYKYLDNIGNTTVSDILSENIEKTIQIKNKNDKNKTLLPYLINKSDINNKTNEKVMLKCPECGFEKEISINQFYQSGFSCNKCSDSYSFPNKAMFNILEQLNVDFKTEYTPKWINPKHYDFYIPLFKTIIEMDGGFHYIDNNMNGVSKEESQAIDNYKDKIAKQYGIEVIRINCDYPNVDIRFEYVKNNIMQDDRLNKLFNLSQINWEKCNEFSLSNRIKEACDLWSSGEYNIKEIAKIMKIHRATISTYLKTGNELNWCNYNSFKEMKHYKEVICLNDCKMFNSVSEAGKQYDIQITSIVQCCKNNSKYKYIYSKLIDKKLVFVYYEDYKKMSNNAIEEKMKYTKEDNRNGNKAPVICLNTLEVFESITEACKYINNKNRVSAIIEVCKGKRKHCGKHPLTGERLSWMYYKEYLEQ